MRAVWLFAALFVLFGLRPAQAQLAPEGIPEPMLLADEGDEEVLHIMLMGTATKNIATPGLIDALQILAIRPASGSVSLLSIPRDLYVNIPGLGMGKINQAYFYGETREGGRGVELLRATIAYNLGIVVDRYARINFTGFKQLIDRIGGIRITTDCVIEDWRLITPELDEQVEENWAMFTLPIGRHLMDGDLTLWYVRSRRNAVETDRGRRQQDVLRAIWRRMRERGLLGDLPALYQNLNQIVETDVTLDEMLGLLPMALNMDLSQVSFYRFRQGVEIESGYTPDANRRFVWVPQREAVQRLVADFVQPPTRSRLGAEPPTIGIINTTGIADLAYIAADRLELEGFRTTILNEPPGVPREYNKIIDYTGADKGSLLPLLQRVLRVSDEGVQIEPDPQRTVDFRLYIGWRYQFTACTWPIRQPTPTPVPDS